jgi:hypothetical protein
LLETIKAYVENRPADAGEVDRRRELHAAHFADRARFDSILYTADLFRLARLRPDLSNLQVAADWLEAQHRWEGVADIVHSTAALHGMASPVQLTRVRRCLAHDVSPGAKDRLKAVEAYLTFAIGDWSGFREACEALQASDNVDARAFGLALMSLAVGRRAPERAYQLLDRIAALYGPDSSSEIRLVEASYRCLVAAISNDLHVAQEMADRVRQLYTGQILFSGTRYALLISGITAWCNGDPSRLADAIEIVKAAETNDLAGSQTLEFASALVAVSKDEVSGSHAIRRYALDVASGPEIMSHSDALILLAELAERQGDPERAVALLRSTGHGRGPLSTLVGHQLAERLGVYEEIEHTYAANATDQEWMVERPKQALRAELRRRGWSDPRHHTPTGS